MTEQVMLKTLLTLFTVETEIEKCSKSLDDREKDILRWSIFFLHMGSAKRSCKTSKQHTMQLVSARCFLQLYRNGAADGLPIKTRMRGEGLINTGAKLDIENIDLVLRKAKRQIQPGEVIGQDINALFYEDKPCIFMQTGHNLSDLFEQLPWKRGSGIDIIFRLIVLYNCLPGIGSR